MLEDALHSAESLDHVCPVVVEVPQLSIVLLMGPPERILLQDLVLFEILSHAPPLVVRQCQSIFLEECVYPWHASVPGIFQII